MTTAHPDNPAQTGASADPIGPFRARIFIEPPPPAKPFAVPAGLETAFTYLHDSGAVDQQELMETMGAMAARGVGTVASIEQPDDEELTVFRQLVHIPPATSREIHLREVCRAALHWDGFASSPAEYLPPGINLADLRSGALQLAQIARETIAEVLHSAVTQHQGRYEQPAPDYGQPAATVRRAGFGRP